MPWKTPFLRTFLFWLHLQKHALSMRNDSQTFKSFFLNLPENQKLHWPYTPTHLPLFFMSHCSFDFLSYYGGCHHSLHICIQCYSQPTPQLTWRHMTGFDSSNLSRSHLCHVLMEVVHALFLSFLFLGVVTSDVIFWMIQLQDECVHTAHNIPRCEGK